MASANSGGQARAIDRGSIYGHGNGARGRNSTERNLTNLLSDLFATSTVAVNVPSNLPSNHVPDPRSSAGPNLEDPSRSYSADSRGTAYYDETLKVAVLLRIPTSTVLVPPSSGSTIHSEAVPLPLPKSSPTSPFGVASEQHAIPPPLYALLFCLHVALEAAYIPRSHTQGPSQPQHLSLVQPVPTVHQAHQSYQLAALGSSIEASLPPPQPAQSSHPTPSVSCFSATWAGNKAPDVKKAESDGISASSSSAAAATAPSATPSEPPLDPAGTHRGWVSYERNHWTVKWLCDVPVTFVSTQFDPLLSLTASLTLRLASPFLDHGLPDADEVRRLSTSFSHTLLSPLHEGPIYPDESTSERLARSRVSSALGLDGPNGLGSHLSQLGKQVLGSQHAIMTPQSGLQGLQQLERRRRKMLETALESANRGGDEKSRPSPFKVADDDGDLGESSQRTGRQDGTTQLSDGDEREPSTSGASNPPQLHVLKRSSRLIMDVKSGLGVRMRTLFTPFSPFTAPDRGPSDLLDDAEADEDHFEGEDPENAFLVLCIELENTAQSGLEFDVDSVRVHVEQTGDYLSGEPRAIVKLLGNLADTATEDPVERPFPVRLRQGQQRNLLYYLSIENDDLAREGTEGKSHRLSGQPATAKRNVAIIVSGRPVLLLPPEAPTDMPADPVESAHPSSSTSPATELFDSRWNCTLDLSPLYSSARRHRPYSGTPSDAAQNQTQAWPTTARGNGGIGRPASQQVYPPTAGSVRHSALALEQAYHADMLRNPEKLAQHAEAHAGMLRTASFNGRQTASTSAMGTSLSFATAAIGGRG